MTNATNKWREGEFLIESYPTLLTISRNNRYIQFQGRDSIKLFQYFTDDITDIPLITEYFDDHSIREGLNYE